MRPALFVELKRRLALVGAIEDELALGTEGQKRSHQGTKLVRQNRWPIVDGLSLFLQAIVLFIERLIGILRKLLVLQFRLDRCHPGIDYFKSLGLFVRERKKRQCHPEQPGGGIVGVGCRDGPNPGEPRLIADARRLSFHLLTGKLLRDLRIDPAIAAVAEKVTVYGAARLDIGGFADQLRHRIACLHRLVGDGLADHIGIGVTVLVVAVIDDELLVAVFGRGIGLSEVERDFAGGERIENGIGEVRKAQALLDEAAGLPETLGDSIDVPVNAQEVPETPCLPQPVLA